MNATRTRFTFETRLRLGREREYERIHSTTPPELDAVLRAAGTRFWRIERDGRSLHHYVEVDDLGAFTSILNSDGVHLRWSALISPLLVKGRPRRTVVHEFGFGRGSLVWELPSG